MSQPHRRDASKRAVNLALNDDVVFVAERTRCAEADRSLSQALEAWNEFDEAGVPFSDAHSTL